jgi:YD repeat-containing protein
MTSVVFLNSCESEDVIDLSNDFVEPKILLSKVTTVYYDNPANPQTNIATFTYNNKGELAKIISEGRTSNFEYDGAGKPTKTNYYKADGTLDYYSTYTYNGDQLLNIKAIYTNPDFNRTISYTYENGKMVTSTLCQSANCSNPSTSSYTYNGENITVETSVIGGTFSTSTKHEYLYDNQLNPFTYTNKYFKVSIGGAYVLSKNNYTTERISYKDGSGNWIQNQYVIYDVQYNSAQLPTQVVGKLSDGSNYVKYNYEYITQ